MRRVWHSILIAIGFVSLALGIVGTVVPLIPTTPLLLLAAFCFARSSDRFYGWLLSNRLFGETISAYRDGLGLPLRQKIVTLAILWVTVISTSVFAIPLLWVRILLGCIALGVTAYVLSLPTRREPTASQPGVVRASCPHVLVHEQRVGETPAPHDRREPSGRDARTTRPA